jgi:ketosteroid isomerase-like protein
MQHRAITIYASVVLWSQPVAALAENFLDSEVSASSMSPATANTDAKMAYELLVRMFDRWNARDLDGLMSVYWNSPSLLAVIDTEQFDGWENLYRLYKNRYRNPVNMGIVSPTRIQVELLKPDLAFGVVSWTMRYPENTRASEIVGTTTMDIQKFETDWKIVAVHSSFTEM